jgi:hypothetical protein
LHQRHERRLLSTPRQSAIDESRYTLCSVLSTHALGITGNATPYPQMAARHLSVNRLALDPPSLQELADCLSSGIPSYFGSSSVTVTKCPDLRQGPFHLAGAGLCGQPVVADVGGQANLSPMPDLSKKYSLLKISKLMEMQQDTGFLLGAAAGPFHVLGKNSELMPNFAWKDADITNQTRYAEVREDGSAMCDDLDSTDCGLMANLFGSSGISGPVLHIAASSRTGSANFTSAIRAILAAKYGTKPVSLGGVFLIKRGSAKLHVMPDFSATALHTDEEKQNWLRYYDTEAPIVCLTVVHSHDPGLDLRIEHTHCFTSDGSMGGHYHFDISPEDIEYEAYFNVAEVVYRIDRPVPRT